MNNLNSFIKINQRLSFEKIKFFSLNIKNIFNKNLFKFLFVFGLIIISNNVFSICSPGCPEGLKCVKGVCRHVFDECQWPDGSICFKNEIDGKCECRCSSRCKTCYKNENDCTSCKDGYILSNHQCKGKKTTITLYKQGGTGGTDSVTATFGSSMPSITPPTRTGYIFGGYYWHRDCVGTQYYYSNGSSATSWDKDSGSSSLEACWRPKTTTITLYKQGGTGGTDSVIATYDSSMPSITLPTRTGYNFTGYRYTSDPSSDLYYSSNGSSYRNWNKESNTNSLYAHWQVKTITCPSGTYLSANLENCTPCKNGSYCVGGNYTFSSSDKGITTCPSGYDTSARNREKIGDCQIVCNGNYYVPQYGKCTSCPSGYHSSGVRLWYGDSSTCSKINYTITYDWNGGTANSLEKTQNIRFEEYLPNVTLPTKTGYRFKSYNYTYNGNNYKLYYEGNRNKAYINSSLYNDYKWNIPFDVTLKADWELASCQQNQYLSGNSCYNCPSPYAKSEAGTNTKNKCYADDMLGKYIEGSSIKQCDAGHYCPDNVLYYGQTGMKSCDQKYPNALPGSKLLTDCHAFIAWGIYRKFKGTSGYDFDDLKCEEGYYCPGGTKHSYSDNHTIGETFNLNKCPDEYPYSKKENRNIDDCYKKETNITNCNIFEGGITKGGEDKSKCTSCKPGYNLSGDGKSCSLKTNLSCPAGEYLKAGEDTCSGCPEESYCPGFSNFIYNGSEKGRFDCNFGYTSSPRSSSSSQCYAKSIFCSAGKYLPQNSLNCSSCTFNSYCIGGTYSYSETTEQGKMLCSMLTPMNTYINSNSDSTQESDCYLRTTEGKYVSVLKGTEELCPVDSYCEGNVIVKYGLVGGITGNCGDGYKNNLSAGKKSKDDCYKMCVKEDIEYCNTIEGTITETGINTCICTTCESGYESSLDGKKCIVKSNLSCPAGEYLKAGEDTCSPCEEGHYCTGFNNHTYNGNKYGIEECPEGYRSNQAKGLTSIESCQIKCERDTYLKNAYDTNCTQCNQTFGSELNYINYGSTSSCTAYPITCMSGTYRPANQNSCSPCEEGSYCEGGSFIYDKNNNQGIRECPEGYVDGGIGLKSENECIKKCGIGSTGGKTKQGIDIEYEDPIESQVNYDNKCRYNKCSVKVGNRRVKGFIDNGECKIQCDPGYRMNNGTCEICNIAHATKYRSDGILECEVEECEEGYHATINGCEISKRECKKENIKKGYEYYREGIWGICEIEECNNGYHEEEGRCVLNKRSCEVINGIGEEEYDTVKKEWKRCKATRCNPGYTNDVYKKNGGDINDCGECKNRYERNGEIAVISYIQECEIASCVNEGSLYRLNDRRDRCEIMCIEGEDESGRIYWDSITNRCEIECNDSYIMW